ncbi:MAG TPA: hypothetical protein DEV98_09160 [Clostridiales bacterium]|nr:hypothetical protein [Clostridiales bacterium]
MLSSATPGSSAQRMVGSEIGRFLFWAILFSGIKPLDESVMFETATAEAGKTVPVRSKLKIMINATVGEKNLCFIICPFIKLKMIINNQMLFGNRSYHLINCRRLNKNTHDRNPPTKDLFAFLNIIYQTS